MVTNWLQFDFNLIILSGFGRYFGAIKVFGHEFDVSAILSQFSGKYCFKFNLISFQFHFVAI